MAKINIPKIKIYSDLHFEFHRDCGKEFISKLKHKDPEVVILAGDICVMNTKSEQGLHYLSEHFPNSQLLWVLGNHECYYNLMNEAYARADQLTDQIENLTLLENSHVTINGQRYIGSTLWFPYNKDNELYASALTDFRVIFDFEDYVYARASNSAKWLARNIKSDDIVITHHLPAKECVHPFYHGSQLNRFFLHDIGSTILKHQPKLWAYGHTHIKRKTKINDTTLICNATGYPGEHKPS